MIAFVFAISLGIFAICFWRAFGELDPPRGVIGKTSSSLGVGVGEAIAKRDGRAS
jgi:hypothetical protein